MLRAPQISQVRKPKTPGQRNINPSSTTHEPSQVIHPEARKELPASLIAETWARLLAEVGAKESYADTHVVLPAGERIEEDAQLLGTVVGVTTLNCEAGEMMGRVAVDDQLRVVGLLIVTPEYSPLPF